MKTSKSQRGYTLYELLIVIVVFSVALSLVLMLICLPMANFWITEKGALKAAKVANPASAEILKIQRNTISFSEIVVQNSDRTLTIYEVDSNVLFNYKLRNVPAILKNR